MTSQTVHNAKLSTPLGAGQPEAAVLGKVPIWDAPVRVIHWLAALSFLGAWLTAEADGWRAVHISFGLTLAGLMVVRVLWGFVGTRPARFASFVRGPSAVWAHFRALVQGESTHESGHNPAGGWAVLALIGLSLALTLSGWLVYTQGESLEDLHEALAEGLLALVALHVVAVIFTSWLQRANLVRAMVDGRQAAPAQEAIPSAYRGLGLLILVAVLAFWVWGMGPTTPFTGAADGSRAEHSETHRTADKEADDD